MGAALIPARETRPSVSSFDDPYSLVAEILTRGLCAKDPPGVYMVNGQLSTYQQSQGAAPTPHAAGASSNCQAVATVGGAAAAYASVLTTFSLRP